MAGLVVTGCGSPSVPTDGGPPDMGSMPPVTNTYVIGLIQTAPADTTGGVAFGFDLDNMLGGTPGGCTDAADFNDAYPPSGLTASAAACTAASHNTMATCLADTAHHCLFGANNKCYADGSAVDNQLGTALPVLGNMLGMDGADGAIRDQIQAGKILLILQVSDINSYTSDSSVMVQAVLGVVRSSACTAHADMASCAADTANHCAFAAAAGGTPASCNAAPMPSTVCMAHADMASCQGDIAGACNWSMTSSHCTGIAANQAFSTLMTLGAPVMGSIDAGRLSATTAMLPLSFAAMGRNISLVLRSVHFGGRISATTITSGEFGAQVLVDDIVMLAMTLGVTVTRSTIEGFVSPDLVPGMDTNAACGAHTDMPTCMADAANYCAFAGGHCTGAAAGAHCSSISAGMGYTAIQAMLTP